MTWENVGNERLRHPAHRFEWTQREFQTWEQGRTETHGYAVRFVPVRSVGDKDRAPTRMGVFNRG